MKAKENDYIISGGEAGKSRLNVLAEVMRPYTRALLEAGGPLAGKKFLDLGCGGGHVSLMAAAMAGETGHVTGIDADPEIIALAQKDAAAAGARNVSFRAASAYDIAFTNEFDMAYSRFLLSHLQQSSQVLQCMLEAVKPGGSIVVEDVHFSGHFCYPQNEAFDAYLNYYTSAAHNNGQNPEIGPALPGLFREAGIAAVQFDVIQPCFSSGQGKWMAYITLDKIKEMVLKQGLADAQTLQQVLQGLEAFTQDAHSMISLPRIFRVWGRKAMRSAARVRNAE